MNQITDINDHRLLCKFWMSAIPYIKIRLFCSGVFTVCEGCCCPLLTNWPLTSDSRLWQLGVYCLCFMPGVRHTCRGGRIQERFLYEPVVAGLNTLCQATPEYITPESDITFEGAFWSSNDNNIHLISTCIGLLALFSLRDSILHKKRMIKCWARSEKTSGNPCFPMTCRSEAVWWRSLLICGHSNQKQIKICIFFKSNFWPQLFFFVVKTWIVPCQKFVFSDCSFWPHLLVITVKFQIQSSVSGG